MWNRLSQVATQAKSIAKTVAQEALETVEELRSVHQVGAVGPDQAPAGEGCCWGAQGTTAAAPLRA